MRRRTRTTAYVAVACFALLPGTAAAKARARQALAVSPVTLTRLDCVSGCAPGKVARPGALLRLRGKLLKQTDQVRFLGIDGEYDDVAALPETRRPASVDVRVPLGAPSGPVAILDRDGAQTAPTLPLMIAPEAPGGPPIELAARTPRAFYDASQGAGVTYVVHGSAPANVGIDLVRVLDGFVVEHWDAYQVQPEMPQRIDWDGTMDGKVQRAGRYAFRLTPPATPAGAAAASAEPVPDAPFDFARDRFPILGPHTFGTGAAAFGGPRGHQGQDTFAACGTPLVAAHGGTVQYAGFHALAGYYLVIDNAGAGTDYVYMHLRRPALVQAGDDVLIGQAIGEVGDTGDADGCHLHFEIWTAPGWYSGGHPIDPLPFLTAWDQASRSGSAAR